MRPADLHLDTDSFMGPFDLLCTVLLRRELSLADVQLVEVVVGYVQQLAVREQVDVDTASEFLLLVAALMEIKARELLAVDEDLDIDEPTLDVAKEEMLERLIRYETFRAAARDLAERGSAERWWRVASRPVIRRDKTWGGPVLDAGLLRRSMEVLLAESDVDVRHLVGTHASVHDMTVQLLNTLRSKRSFMLEDAVEGLSRLDQAVAFVAALELCRHGHVELLQPEPFGPIEVAMRANEDAEPGHRADGPSEFDDETVVTTDSETEFQIA